MSIPHFLSSITSVCGTSVYRQVKLARFRFCLDLNLFQKLPGESLQESNMKYFLHNIDHATILKNYDNATATTFCPYGIVALSQKLSRTPSFERLYTFTRAGQTRHRWKRCYRERRNGSLTRNFALLASVTLVKIVKLQRSIQEKRKRV